MFGCGGSQILCGDVQIDLCARNLPMSEKISDRNETNTGAHQMSRESVSHAMR